MKRLDKVLIVGFLAQFVVVGSALAQADKIVGEWRTTDQKAKVKITKEKTGYAGRIVWLKSVQDGNSTPLDADNKDPALRDRPILGINIIEGLQYDEGEWNEGELYDPESGKTYDCLARFEEDEDQLEIRGYLGMPTFGRSVFWERVEHK
ncbi:DUF2147 domain-containing protein [Echinicola strongylocentroti]|uniref:DUF2147 domain-containing protein n=1 Tax=Echinicola strongylocentroti TaxID=1795355 RepID=A0A2Z4IPE2_9BACT|nr:DUF2147 domain-containing protein [Echinicola strongylocentroti]AWW32630.1 DUF2147 domain-containing protein [Echinicola strongylocentroti]